MKKLLFSSMIIIMMIFADYDSWSQEPSKTELKQMLTKFKNYRFGNIALYEITNVSEIRTAIESKEMVETLDTVRVDDEAIKGISDKLKRFVEDGVDEEKSKDEIAQDLINDNIDYQDEDLDKLYSYYMSKKTSQTIDRIEKVYVITTKPKKGKLPETIIAMIVSKKDQDMVDILKSVNKSNIYIYDELKNFELDSSYSATNMYDLLVNAFVQMNVQNKTTEMQGIGEPGFYYAQKFGVTKSIASNERDYSDEDIQAFMRISRGEPHELGLTQNEVIISGDLISWRHYKEPMTWDDNDNYVLDTSGSANSTLPIYGLELKYGIDNINYQSFWSERLTAYALWKSAKLGVILPTAGWSNLSTDLFDQSRKMTNAGVGVAGEFDFPIKIIPKSGLFRLSFGYVFGDAVEADYKDRDLTIDYAQFNDNYIDYLVRSDFTFHYTFALAVDLDYQFRFGFGVSGYDVERWYYKQITNENQETELNYQLLDDDFIFGLSGRAEFMAVNLSTPFGAYIQYFDEALSGSIWLQIPLYENRLALKLEAKAFSPLFREEHTWEVGGLFTPMARFIVTF